MTIGMRRALVVGMQTNPHEAAARARKVLRVVACLLGGPLSIHQLRTVVPSMSAEEWTTLAECAGVKPLSAETRAAIIAELNRLSGEIARVA
jgi:hypothetical protein